MNRLCIGTLVIASITGEATARRYRNRPSPENVSNWMLIGVNSWLEPVYRRMHELLLGRDILYADETIQASKVLDSKRLLANLR